ncbi:MAG TPA: SDR family NAD(P)-dependent oxidoreductase [Pseudonocardia sp.]|nr:SDR family NAD(P)-dependent oxidoreductase [Pseudonocardia sp.]
MTRPAERSVRDLRIVVTGATEGIGKEIARGLVDRGAAVTIVARNEAKAEATVRELAAGSGGAHVPEVVLADLSDLGSVRRAADELGSRYDRIDVLVNNAGIAALRPAASVDGFELMMATNHLGPFLLTNLLLPVLTKSAPARIVNTASEAHRFTLRPDPATLAQPLEYGPLGGQAVYGRSKLMNVLSTAELARRLAGTGVTVNCFCPGFVATGLTRDLGERARSVARVVSRTPLLRRPEQGARLGLRLVLDPEMAAFNGRFFTSTPGAGLVPAVASRSDVPLQRRLWERSAELVGLG